VRTPERPGGPSLEELEGEAARARGRLALYRRRIYLGRGEARRLAELERELRGCEERLRGARRAVEAAQPGGGAAGTVRSGQPGS
jgi:hypothetical protein